MDVLSDDPEVAGLEYAIASKNAKIDSLTGVYNRNGLKEELEKIMAIATRESINLTMMMVDADKFKNINDKYGHIVGDKVLQIIANSLKARLRISDIVARYGGDEFVAILVGYNTEENKLSDQLNESIRTSVEDVPFNELGVSIGFHQWDGKETVDEMMTKADLKMYDKKKPRRNHNYVAE